MGNGFQAGKISRCPWGQNDLFMWKMLGRAFQAKGQGTGATIHQCAGRLPAPEPQNYQKSTSTLALVINIVFLHWVMCHDTWKAKSTGRTLQWYTAQSSQERNPPRRQLTMETSFAFTPQQAPSLSSKNTMNSPGTLVFIQKADDTVFSQAQIIQLMRILKILQIHPKEQTVCVAIFMSDF